MRLYTSKKVFSVLCVGFVLCLFLVEQVAAQSISMAQEKKAELKVPSIMSYEGYITDNNGQPLADGQYNFTFALYTTPEGDTPIWTEEHNSVPVKNGVVQLYLGRGTPPNPLNLAFDRQYFLGIKVGNNPEMTPRLELTSTGYSFRARIADEVPNGSITTEKLAPRSVTNDKIESVSWSKITDIPGDVLSGLPQENLSTGTGGNNNPLDHEDKTKYITSKGSITNVIDRDDDSNDRIFSVRRDGPCDDDDDRDDCDDDGGNEGVELFRIQEDGKTLFSGSVTISDSLNVDGITSLRNTTESTATTNGALIVSGGVGIAKRINVGGDGFFESNLGVNGITSLNNTTESTATTNGALVVAGGVGIAKRINVGGAGFFESTLGVNGITSLNNTTESTTTTNGALVVAGGVGIGKRLNVGSALSVAQNGTFGGSVGIGAAAPSNMKLYVSGQGTYVGNHIALFENTGSSAGDGIAIKLNAATPDNQNNFVTFLDASSGTRGRIEGQNATDVLTSPEYIFYTFLDAFELGLAIADVTAAAGSANVCAGVGAVACPPIASLIIGAAAKLAAQAGRAAATQAFLFTNLGVTYQSGSGDYAEYLERINPGEEIEPGDIVGVVGGKVSKLTKGAHQIMTVSLSPIVLGNLPPEDDEYRYEKVAFLGQVPVKVLGTVASGDYIIPSGREDGTGIAVSPEMMTADEFGKVVGRAWGSSDNEFLKLVNVVVGLNSGDIAGVIKKQQRESQSLKVQLNELKAEVAQLKSVEQKVARLQTAFDRILAGADKEYAFGQ